MCQLIRSVKLDFRQFLDGSWTEIPSSSLTRNEVPFTMQNEAHREKKKKKVFKPLESQTYLTLNLIAYLQQYDLIHSNSVF